MSRAIEMSTAQPNPEPDAEALRKLREEVRASIERTDELIRRLEKMLAAEPLPDSTGPPLRRPPQQPRPPAG
jgi:hypothetical protein